MSPEHQKERELWNDYIIARIGGIALTMAEWLGQRINYENDGGEDEQF